MCGILGFVPHPDGTARFSPQEWEKALYSMRMRGPDAVNTLIKDGVHLGHTRLAIIDLEGGAQPFSDPSKQVDLVYNGEIYNYQELREELTEQGIPVQDNSDTAVLLASYIAWGEDCLDKLDGIFAFAIIDHRTQRFFAARDHVGAKPFYWANNEQGIYFASSIRALLELRPYAPSLNLKTFNHYITTIKNSFDDQTFLEGIHQLRPAEKISTSLSHIEVERERYWHAPILAPEEKPVIAIEEASEEIKSLLHQTVKNQMISDVPVAAFLSGGLDSSILCKEIKNQGASLRAYNASCAEEGFDESSYARLMAKETNMELEEVVVTPETFWTAWQELIALRGIPLSTPNEISIYLLAKKLGAHAKVALSGEGADEVFGGYTTPQFGAHDFAKGREKISFLDAHSPNIDRELWDMYGRNCFDSRWDHFLLLNSWCTAQEKQALLQPAIREYLQNDRVLINYYHSLFDKYKTCSNFDAHLHIHTQVNLENLLNRVDHATMSASVETRVPFTSKQLLEKVFAYHDAHKMNLEKPYRDDETRHCARYYTEQQAIQTKRLLRKAYSAEIPKEIILRPKMSFPAPFEKWLSTTLFTKVCETINQSDLLKELVSKESLQHLTKDQSTITNKALLWPLTNIALWESYISG